MAKRWTKDEVAVLLEHNETMGIEALAKKIGRPKAGVRKKLKKVLKEIARKEREKAEKKRRKERDRALGETRNYRTIIKKMSVEIREYPPQKRTIYYYDKAYHLQFPYVIMARVGNQHLYVAFATEPIKSTRSLLYRPPLPNIHDAWHICTARHIWDDYRDQGDGRDLFDHFWMSGFNHDLQRGMFLAWRYFKSWYNWLPPWADESGFRKWQKLNLKQVCRKMKRRARGRNVRMYADFLYKIGCRHVFTEAE